MSGKPAARMPLGTWGLSAVRTAAMLTVYFTVSGVGFAANPQNGGASRTVQPNATAAINVGPADLSSTTAEAAKVPRAYRTMSPEQAAEELRRLRGSARSLPKGSSERQRVEDMVHALEIYDKTGVDPNALVEEIAAKVSEIRGLKLLQPIKFRIMDRVALHAMLESKLEEDLPPNFLAEYEFVAKLVGGIPERTNLRKTMISLLSEQIAGLYDDKTKTLYVLGEFELGRPLARIILAHEICHALQDQHYNLKHLPLTNVENNDAATAALAVVEGDATLLMQDYAGESLKGSDVLKLLDVFQVDQSTYNSAPYFLRQQLVFPYMGGAEFLTRISLQDPEQREKAFIHPPASTEQVMHPEKFSSADVDPPTTVTIPALQPILGSGWTRTMRSNWGEFQIKILFEHWREWNKAPVVAEGWGGDQFVLYRNGPAYAYFAKSLWDTEKDAEEFFEGFSTLLKEKRYRDVLGNTEFEGNLSGEKRLDYTPKEGGEASPEVHLRFRKTGKAVLVEITNSAPVTDLYSRLDALLFSNDPTPAGD